MRRALAIIGAAVLLVIAGCSLSGATPVPPEPFSDFVVTSPVASTAARTSCT
jgi:hypothetical protein